MLVLRCIDADIDRWFDGAVFLFAVLLAPAWPNHAHEKLVKFLPFPRKLELGLGCVLCELMEMSRRVVLCCVVLILFLQMHSSCGVAHLTSDFARVWFSGVFQCFPLVHLSLAADFLELGESKLLALYRKQRGKQPIKVKSALST